ncbi:hypothetical protein AB1285_20415 [Microbacterium sp. NRRL B-14842]|uniref:hypothetical protein n=1 Tax=Microbacterium sp. NRRL B-14842 TaxID=3162881 RepID=UPI003D278244
MTTLSSTTDPSVCLDGVSVRFGERDALRDLTLSIGVGEVVAVSGPNGAGSRPFSRSSPACVHRREGSGA